MTRKEAIKVLEDERKTLCDFQDEVIEAYNMAIQALEQEPCEDVVSRQKVLEIIERNEFKGDAFYEIEQLPPVQPMRKRGKWIKTYKGARQDDAGNQIAMYNHTCSICDWTTGTQGEKFSFCPKCGADMREDGE